MPYDSAVLGIETSPGSSPRGGRRVRESFYYTLVFPARSSHEQPRVNYGEVCEMLRGVTAGGSAREVRTIKELQAAWEIKFRSGSPQLQDMIPFPALQELVRDVIIARFALLPGMTIQSRAERQGSGRLLLSFRPSSALLRATAERLKMRVPASGALEAGLDGGKVDVKLWGQAEAQEEIYRLFLAGKITAEEVQIFGNEDSGMWSRRLRALQRAATSKDALVQDQVVNLPFRDIPSLRYVYRQIDDEGEGGGDVGGSRLSPFRVVDKIRLTKSLVDSEFDCDALVERGLLECHLCPHTYYTTDVDTSLDALRAQWGALPTPCSAIRWLLYRNYDAKVASDPLVHVRNYFGEQLALYFAFASFSARTLQVLGILALLLAAVASKTSMHKELEAIFCLCLCAFLATFVRKWERREANLAARWSGGTPRDSGHGVNPLLQLPRPQFRGQMRRSPVTLRMEAYLPFWKCAVRRLASSLIFTITSLEVGAGYATVVASDRFQELTTEASWRFNAALCVIALTNKCVTPHLARCSQALTNWENHRLQRDYDSHLTFKFATLQSANCFGALWGLAFLRPLRCKFSECRFPKRELLRISNSDQAARLLLLMLGLEAILSLWNLRWAIWSMIREGSNDAAKVSMETKGISLGNDWTRGGAISPKSALLAPVPTTSPSACSGIEAELTLAPYEGVLFDYAQVLIPLGFVAWFASLAPFASCTLAWLVAALQIRADAYKLCCETQRPFPAEALSVGAWLGYMHVLRIGAILHSTAFMLVLLLNDTAADLDQRTIEQRVVSLCSLFAFVGWVAYVLKDPQDLTEERFLKTLKARQTALESKYLGHLGTHLATSAKTALPSGRVFLNGVPHYMVTGDKEEEDAAEDLHDQWRQLQMQMLRLEKRVIELRSIDNGTRSVGMLYVEVQGVSLLPLASPVRAFVQLCVQPTTVENVAGTEDLKASEAVAKDSSRCTASLMPSSRQEANTSLSKKSHSPLWHESFELPVAALGDTLLVRVCEGGLMLHRRTLGRTQLRIDDIIVRTSSHVSPVSTIAASTSADAAVKLKPATPAALSPLSLSSSSTDEEKGAGVDASSISDTLRMAEVPMATYELPLELPESLRRIRQSELGKLGPPRLALRCGMQLNELGELLVQQRRLREKVAIIRSQEIHLSRWGTDGKRASERLNHV